MMKKIIFIFLAFISCSTASDDDLYNYDGPPTNLEQSCSGALECFSWCDFDSICNMECADGYPDHWYGARRTLLVCDLEPDSNKCLNLLIDCE